MFLLDIFYTHFLFLFAVSGFVLLVCVISFCKKKNNKKFKIGLITSITLLLNLQAFANISFICNYLWLSLLFVTIIFICNYLWESFLFVIICNHLLAILFYLKSLSESDFNFAVNSASGSESESSLVLINLHSCIFLILYLHYSKQTCG